MSPAQQIQLNRDRLQEAWHSGTWPDWWAAMDYEINIRIIWKEFMHDYIEKCLKTCNEDYEGIKSRLNDPKTIRLLHGGLGMGEAGEILEHIKKFIYYGKPLDHDKIKKEIGDLLWYLSLIIDYLESDYEEIMEMNIEKLTNRYNGGSFDPKLATEKRDENV